MTNTVTSILLKEAKKIKDKDVAVMLSGGVDSCSILFSLLKAGKNVKAYSFTLDSHESTDFKSAKSVCNEFKIDFTPIYLPTDIGILKRDVKHLILNKGLRKKTEIECSWAMMYAIKHVKEKAIFTGHGADGHFGLSKRAMIHFKHSAEKMDEFRSDLFSNPNYSQKLTLEDMALENDKSIILPYLTDDMKNLFIGKSWEEINKPKEKQPILNSFPEYFKRVKIRKHSNFQLGDSGIAEVFSKLLETDFNIRNYKSVVGIYNSIARKDI
jgi:asparagine synthetase B (glutamine-hydrolysing)